MALAAPAPAALSPFPGVTASNTPYWLKPRLSGNGHREFVQVSKATKATTTKNAAASGLGLALAGLVGGAMRRMGARSRCKARCAPMQTLTQTKQVKKMKKFQMLRDFLGIGVLLGSFQAAWHILPVFLDLKIAADPSLPMLTESTLPVAKTAIFTGWLAGSVCLRHAMNIFSKEELVVASASGLLLVALATVILPHLTGGSLMVFTMLRFVYGILMNIATVQIVLLQMKMPADRRHQAVVWKNVFYSIVSILVAFACGGPTLNLDWRLEALLWYALPPLLGLCVSFPNWCKTLRSLPSIAKHKLQTSKRSKAYTGRDETTATDALTPTMRRHEIALATCFVACGCAFFGLSYSARQLSSNVYKSSMLLNMADILGFLAAMSADVFGRKRVQSCCFTLAAICLLVCSTGVPGSAFVLSFAVIGRSCLDVSFTTVLVAMANIFPESAQKRVLPTFAIATRTGSLLAPFMGTLPAAISCPLFSALCFVAAGASLILPDTKNPEISWRAVRDDYQTYEKYRRSDQPSMTRPLWLQQPKPKLAILYLPQLWLKQSGGQTVTNATSP